MKTKLTNGLSLNNFFNIRLDEVVEALVGSDHIDQGKFLSDYFGELSAYDISLIFSYVDDSLLEDLRTELNKQGGSRGG